MKYLALFALLFVWYVPAVHFRFSPSKRHNSRPTFFVSFSGVMADDKIGHNMCKCHIQVADQPEDKKLILDVFKNDVHIDACNDAGLEHCKKFCLDTVSSHPTTLFRFALSNGY